VLWHWWPVAFLGFVFGIYGGLITLMTALAAGGKQSDDLLIDAEARTVEGRVEKIDQDGTGIEPMRLSYTFTLPNGQERFGRSFLRRPGTAEGDRITIEYAASKPYVSRAKGGRLNLAPRLDHLFFWVLLLPGLLLISTWAIAVLRLHHLMCAGDVGIAELRAVETLPFIVPSMIRVTYSYRDHRARQRIAAHWVRARSALGQRLVAQPTHLPVVLNRSGRGVSRLVMADDFVVQHAGRDDPSHTRHS
jgi:hypothetical protein